MTAQASDHETISNTAVYGFPQLMSLGTSGQQTVTIEDNAAGW